MNIWLNNPWAVQRAGNKLHTFQALKEAGVHTPEWTTSYEEAWKWYDNDIPVLGRRVLNGHSGAGIDYVHRPTDDLKDGPSPIDAPLYVQYKKKKKEFRVHVFANPQIPRHRGEQPVLEVIDVQEKRGDTSYDGERNYKVRSHQNGWVFCRENILEPNELRDLAIKACAALGLQFGAVDIIWNEKEDKCYVLEVNTAPGLEGTTLNSYVNAIRRWL